MLQKHILTEALRLSGMDQHATTNDLGHGLAAAEMKLLEESIRSGAEAEAVTMKSPAKKIVNKWFNRTKNKNKSRNSHNEGAAAEVGHVTRNALLRRATTVSVHGDTSTVAASSSDGGSISSSHDDMLPSRLAGRGSSVLLRLGSSFRSNHKAVAQAIAIASTTTTNQTGGGKDDDQLVSTPMTSTDAPSIRQSAKEKARVSYETMKKNDRLGSVCIVEKCYTLIGCEPDEHALIMGPLHQLIDSERKETLEFRRMKAEAHHRSPKRKKNSKLADADVDRERKLENELIERRHRILTMMGENLRLTARQALISHPRSELEHVEKQHYFETNFPDIPNFKQIKLPLPLPRVGKQWALARILLDVGPDSLVFCLKLMLLERSILVVGKKLHEVTACCCALIELIKPFEWPNAFMPVLPQKMLDFINCPVPFVAGIATNNVSAIENDERTLGAMAGGTSLLNLDTNTLHITSEVGVGKLLSLDPYLREQLRLLRSRLLVLCHENPSSALRDFHASSMVV